MVSLKNEKRIIKIIFAAVSILFFLTCIFSIFKYGNATLLGSISNPDNDDVKFIRSAWTLAASGKYIYHNPGLQTAFMMPGVSYTLAFFTLIFGNWGSLTAFRLVQAILQTGSLMLVFFIGRKLFNSRIGIIAMLLNSLCIAEIWTANLILTESFFKSFVLLLVFFCIYAIEENKVKYYVIAGIFWGIATLFRPTIAMFPIVILAMWIIKKYTIKDMIKYTVIVSAIFCVILSPWWIRNYSVFHKFIPLTMATGNPMLQGTYINYDQTSRATDGLDYKQFKYPAGNEIDNNQVEMAISKYRLQNLVPKQPLQFLYWYTVGKTIDQVNYPFYWGQILGVSYAGAGLYYYVTFFLAIFGMVLFFRGSKKNSMVIFPFLTIIYFIVVYLPFFTCARYFYPAMPYMMIFAAVGLVYNLKKFRILTAD
jgi:4-amino-4-deoxy-L-arabinose transferase-like glycosyltransferase